MVDVPGSDPRAARLGLALLKVVGPRGLATVTVAAPLALAALISACTAGGTTPSSDGAGNGSGPGSTIPGVTFGNVDGEDEGPGCNELDVAFEGQVPTALILVDRSSSQWDGYPNHNWDPVVRGLLGVVESVQAQMRLGVITYTGRNGGTCPDLYPALDQLTFAQNNFGAIQTILNGADQPDYKGETPTSLALQAALPVLAAQPNTGRKFILLVTDGEPDFCNDPDRICPMDAVVGTVQQAYAQGISTTVFGLTRDGVALSRRHLQDVANAGAGVDVAMPEGVNRIEDLRNRCGATTSGTYVATGGQAPFFEARGNDSGALQEALDTIIGGLRSCTYDLTGSVRINPEEAGQARITIDNGQPLTFGDANGWRLVNDTQVELTGSACTELKRSGTRGVKFKFPCDALLR
jgi:hypothetical protein